MRTLKLQMQLTLDGFVAGPNGEMDWMTCPWTDDLNNFVGDMVSSLGTIVLGRKLAEGFIPHWAGVAADTNDPEMEAGRLFTDTPKVVFTRTLQEHSWANTELSKGELFDEISRLKAGEGKDIFAYGGGSFVSALIQQGLIDEYYFFINPAAIGEGMPIFKELNGMLKLDLVKSTAFECGVVVLHYRAKQQA